MWDIFSIPYSHNKEKKWDILLHRTIFSLDYIKRHVKSLHKGSKVDKYVVQNLTWSGVYPRSNFSNTLLQKVLTLIPLTSTIPEVFITIMTTFLYYSYDALEEPLTHMKSLKIKSYPGKNVTDY